MPPQGKPKYFATPALFRAWLEKNHAKADELLVGFYKKDSGKPSITWPQSVDEALCYGWIDGVRHSLGEEAYTIRFTPRRPRSIWSSVNVARVRELTKLGLMRPAGLAAFEKRTGDRSGIYGYELKHQAAFDPAHEKLLKANRKAHAFFEAQPPWYRRNLTFWVTSAKKEDTRLQRLTKLIASCAAGKKLR